MAVFIDSHAPHTGTHIQDTGDFVPVVVNRDILESLHRTEVHVKQWGAPIGNQYYKSIMPDVSLTLCANCNKVCL